MTTVQKEIAEQLENLVNERFNLETLNKELSKIFRVKVEAGFVDEENEADLGDWNIMFNCEEEDDRYGYFDIYVLKMRNKGWDNADFYVTEVGYEFDGDF